MDKTIFVVMGGAGQYEDRYDFNLVAFSDEEKAIEEVARLEKQNEYCLELQKLFDGWEREAITDVIANGKKSPDDINAARKETKTKIEEYITENNIDLVDMGWTKFMYEYTYDYIQYSYHPLTLEV
jgi:hypothetical protein